MRVAPVESRAEVDAGHAEGALPHLADDLGGPLDLGAIGFGERLDFLGDALRSCCRSESEGDVFAGQA
jgi:hypothetical protein